MTILVDESLPTSHTRPWTLPPTTGTLDIVNFTPSNAAVQVDVPLSVLRKRESAPVPASSHQNLEPVIPGVSRKRHLVDLAIIGALVVLVATVYVAARLQDLIS